MLISRSSFAEKCHRWSTFIGKLELDLLAPLADDYDQLRNQQNQFQVLNLFTYRTNIEYYISHIYNLFESLFHIPHIAFSFQLFNHRIYMRQENLHLIISEGNNMLYQCYNEQSVEEFRGQNYL